MDRRKATRLTSADELFIFSRTGTVMGASTWSETHVSGGGTSGYLHNGTGTVSTAGVYSTVTERSRFFIVEPSGNETEVKDAGIAVRDGHEVTVVYCGNKADNWGWPAAYRNHNTGGETENTAHMKWLTNTEGRGCAGPLLLFLVVFMVVGSVANILLGLLFGAGGFVGGMIVGALAGFLVVSRRSPKKNPALGDGIRMAIREEMKKAADGVQTRMADATERTP